MMKARFVPSDDIWPVVASENHEICHLDHAARNKEISSKSYAQFIFNILIKTFRLNRMLKPMFHIIIPKIVFIGLGPG